MDNGAELSALLDASPIGEGLQKGLRRIGRLLQMLRDAAADIDPLLTVEVGQVPTDDSAVLRIAIGCSHDPDGIDAVQALVAAAPAMPPRIQVCAFTPPTPKATVRELASLEILGQEIPVQQVRFMAEPSTAAPGTFLRSVLRAGIGRDRDGPAKPPWRPGRRPHAEHERRELCLMTRVNSIGIAVTDQPPPDSLNAWDLVEIIDSAPVH